ncbi:glycosyltransferase family 69 protein, partial [Aspergillus carbonarius ITEM 5010]
MSAAHLLSDYTTPNSQLSTVSEESHDLFEAGVQMRKQSLLEQCLQKLYFLPRLFSYIRYRRRRSYRPLTPASAHPSHCRSFLLQLPYYVLTVLCIVLVLAVLTSTFNPSYTRLPPHYSSLRDTVSQSSLLGRGNLRNEKVFIAASLYDPSGELARGHWGASVLQLISLLGEDNTFLSIYENDSGKEGKTALQNLAEQVTCNKSIVYEDHLDLNGLPKVVIPDGNQRIKRIAYLAETRNRALQPLDEPGMHFDKLLYLNDVAFDPMDALQLLFSTNVDDNGLAQYRAACAVDFINPFKFYDTYGTRDSEGYSLGVPFFPWFSDSGSGQSRRDVLAGKDAVPVRSCWGGDG